MSAIEYSTNLNITYNINDTINKINKIINFGVDFQVFFLNRDSIMLDSLSPNKSYDETMSFYLEYHPLYSNLKTMSFYPDI